MKSKADEEDYWNSSKFRAFTFDDEDDEFSRMLRKHRRKPPEDFPRGFNPVRLCVKASAGAKMAASEHWDDYSVYGQLSDEELLQIAVERKPRPPACSQPPRPPPANPSSPTPQPPTLSQPPHRALPPPKEVILRDGDCSGLGLLLMVLCLRELSPVESAVVSGDAAALAVLVGRRGGRLSEPNADGWLALHEAAYYGQLPCMRVLLRADPGSVNKCTRRNETPLLLAAFRGNVSCVEFLLSHGANVHIANTARETPLYAACECPSEDVVSLLLRAGAQVNRACNQGGTALHEACRYGSVALCRMLLEAGADLRAPNVYSIQPFFTAAQHGSAEVLRLLAQRGADINAPAGDGATPLYESSKNGHVSAVQELLSLKADANRATESGLLPLHIAVKNNHTSVMSLLIPVTSQIRVRRCGISPLHIAAERNRHEMMEMLIESGFDVNARLSTERSKMYEDRRSTALYFCVYNGNMDMAELLLEAGADPNLDTFNALLIAVRRGWVEMAALLVRHGADVNAQISTQPCVFPAAILLNMECLPMLKLLLDHGFISLLLDYVGHVRLCSRLLEILESRYDWTPIKLKTYSWTDSHFLSGSSASCATTSTVYCPEASVSDESFLKTFDGTVSRFMTGSGKRMVAYRRPDGGLVHVAQEPEEEEEPLFRAIREGDARKVRELAMGPGENLMLPSKPGWLAVHQAAWFGKDTCLRMLLAVRGKATICVAAQPGMVNKRTARGETPLMVAATGDNLECVQVLLENGAEPDIPSYDKETPLYKGKMNYRNASLLQACEKSNAAVVAALLNHGAEVNTRCLQGWTALQEAVLRNNVEICEMLLKAGAKYNLSNMYGITPLFTAAQSGQARVRRTGISPLHLAAERNRDDVLEMLIEAGFDVNAQLSEERSRLYEDRRSTVLYFSVYNNNVEAVRSLLAAGADPNLDVFRPLMVAARLGCTRTVSLLVEHGADINASIPTHPTTFPAVYMFSMKYLPLFKYLLDQGGDALSCFDCVYGGQLHPPIKTSRSGRNDGDRTPEAPLRGVQFCEMISVSSISRWAGPIIDVLLDYVGHVTLCSRLKEHLDSYSEWNTIKEKAAPPRPLMQLCRLQILRLVRRRQVKRLPLPGGLIRFLQHQQMSLDDY
ncbi:unnamed protein product [Menidia menidia]|uniref:(Atlantic silverside) hypothetical protein n=1 Tax=Menidia menidia TaxID=238744 RepID=A0A8S4BMC5_9TELE|nr:unnamed protein product [Menidia menidia]